MPCSNAHGGDQPPHRCPTSTCPAAISIIPATISVATSATTSPSPTIDQNATEGSPAFTLTIAAFAISDVDSVSASPLCDCKFN
nr:unnamed protein product [Spirometra erinaceieuropaei]